MKKTKEQILKEYKEKSDEILKRMMQIVMRAQRMVDDEAYRKALKKMEE